MKKENALIVYKTDKLEKVGSLIHITEKILSKSAIQVKSIHWDWWNELNRMWKVLLFNTIKRQDEYGLNDYFYAYYDSDKDDVKIND